tara:strand:+ start:476 stop:1249 length:774 start_codon:yes stop_codon:yes gene_type:complete
MIISHTYKYLFIGLPFSASSAITKELNEKYEGKPILRKHSLYHEFLSIASPTEKKYLVFAVLRNPMEIAVSVYEKMRTNAKGNYCNKKLYKENGGHISKKQRDQFNFIKTNKASFQQFFLKYYTKPLTNLSDLTIKHCDYIIRYENLQEDFLKVLKRCGINEARNLPKFNTTKDKKKDILFYYNEEIRARAKYVFGPFFDKYNYNFPENWGPNKPSIITKLYFNSQIYLKEFKERFFKKRKNQKSIEGSIYGDMQRK